MGAAITFIALFATVFGIMFVFYNTRNKERMALIEKGADASLFNTGKESKPFNWNWSKFTLKIGMLAMGIAAGVLAGFVLVANTVMPEETAYTSMVFFFGGLSLVLFYLIDRKSK
jgi:RsiW-degrading membrane proteinase PrsW (M82 family)